MRCVILCALFLNGGVFTAFCQTTTPIKAASTTTSTQKSTSLAIIGPFEMLPGEMEGTSVADLNAVLQVARTASARMRDKNDGMLFPEGQSLMRLLASNLRSSLPSLNISTVEIVENAIELPSAENLFSEGPGRGHNFIIMVFYISKGDQVRFLLTAMESPREIAIYEAGWSGIFDLSSAMKKAVDVLTSSQGLQSFTTLRAPVTSLAGQAEIAATLSKLPKPRDWPQHERFKNASSSFKTMITATVLSLCAAVVSAGSWQTYREALVRNPAFETGALVSGISTGTTAAATLAFLAVSVWNAMVILQSAR